MAKFPSGKIIAISAAAAGAYILDKVISNNQARDGEALPSGSLGGTDDPLLEQQGFDIDPNTSYPVPVQQYSYNPADPYSQLARESSTPFSPVMVDLSGVAYENPYAMQSQALPEGFKVFVDPDTNKIIGYEDPIRQMSLQGDPFADPSSSINKTPNFYDDFVKNTKSPDTSMMSQAPTTPVQDQSTGLFGTGITAPQYGLGVLGMTGSYATAVGEGAATGKTSLKAAYETGIESIPFVGKQALKQAGEPVVESGVKSLAKRGAKVGIGLIPFAGTVAGAEFDVAVNKKSRPLAYTANIFGDILGGLGAVAGALLGGVGGVAGGIGGQIAGEQAVYQGYDAFGSKIGSTWDKYTDMVKSPMLPSVSAAPYNPTVVSSPARSSQAAVNTQSSVSAAQRTVIQAPSTPAPTYSMVSLSKPSSGGSSSSKSSGGSSSKSTAPAGVKAGTQFQTATVKSSTGQTVTMSVSTGFAAKLKEALAPKKTAPAKKTSPAKKK